MPHAGLAPARAASVPQPRSILGLGAALAFGFINVMWLEATYGSGELDESGIRERFINARGEAD